VFDFNMYVISGRNNKATILFIRKRKVKKGHFTFSIKKSIKKSGNIVDSRHGEQNVNLLIQLIY
jgi:hypothetical protein